MKKKKQLFSSGITPDCVAAHRYGGGGGKGGGSSQTDTSMSRVGSTRVNAGHQVTGQLSDTGFTLLNRHSLEDRDRNTFGDIINDGGSTSGTLNMRKFLQSPQSDITNPTFENATNASFDDRLSRALAVSRTGEANVLAPISRGQSFREADTVQQQLNSRQFEVEGQRELDFRKLLEGSLGMVDTRVKGASGITEAKAGTIMPTEALTKLLAPFQSDTAENIAGKGAQTASGQSWGVQGGASCCFIFLEAYNGSLPAHVRACRDFFAPENTDRREGYIWMSKWLVPAMQKSRAVRWMVNNFMVKPLTEWGGWCTGTPGYLYGFRKVRYVDFWFKTWERIGIWVRQVDS